MGDSAEAVFGSLLPDFLNADLAIANMECPLTDGDTPIRKCGPNLRAPVATIEVIRKAGIKVLNMANNHILDHGGSGLESTLRAAATAGIATVGAGFNRTEARRILICQVKGISVGILGLAEHEFSIATDTSPGANPLDLIDMTRNIADHRSSIDYLIVLLHGGNEYYAYPSPRLMETCRFLVEQGANAVICQHSHCMGCCEEYRGGHIVYGQGSLICGSPNPISALENGVLVQLHISRDGTSRMELLPFERTHIGLGIRKTPPEAAESLLQAMAERSGNLGIPGYIQEHWSRFCSERRSGYLSMVLGHGRVLRHLNRHGLLFRLFCSEDSKLAMENVIRCEAHREVLETVFDEIRGSDTPPARAS